MFQRASLLVGTVFGGLLGSLTASQAQTFIDTATTINSPINDSVRIGFNNAGPFTVDLVAGGVITAPSFTVVTFNTSTFNIAGGDVSQSVYARDSSTINLSGGTIGSFLRADNSSNVTITGGTIGATLSATGTGAQTISVSNGTIHGSISVGQNDTLTLFSGTIDSTITGSSNSISNIRGGSVATNNAFQVFDTAIINFYGTGLAAANPTPSGNGTFYTLSGLLQDGSSVNGKLVFVDQNAAFNLINATTPEPGTFALLGACLAGGLCFARRRKARRVSPIV